jgi:predicted nucleic acid-binding protein
MMEVLAGARDARRQGDLRRLLLRFRLLAFDSVADFEAAASIYRRCRDAGVTPRGLLDCMICAVALRSGAFVLAHDRDLAKVGAVISLPLDPASLAPGART